MQLTPCPLPRPACVSSSVERPSGAFRAEAPAVALLRKLTQLSRGIAQAASLDQILQLAASQAAAILEADQTIIMLMGDDGLAHVRASEGVDPKVAARLSGRLDEALIGRLEEVLAGSSGRSFMAVPLIVQGEVTGLAAAAKPGVRAWGDEAETILAAVADQSAAPIEIARLTQEVRQVRLIAENVRLTEAEREARAALEAERARLVAVVDNIPIGVVLVEAPSGRVVFENRRVAEISGLKDLSIGSIASYGRVTGLHPDGRPYATTEWPLARAILQGEIVRNEEIEIVRPDGTRVHFSINAAPIRSPDGAIVAAVGAFHDVTDRRRVDQHLRQVQQMEAVGRLAGGVAHEANNQMSVVLSASSFILREEELPEHVRHDVQAIQRAAERTAVVTAQLLAFSRRQILRPDVLDLNAVIQDFAPVLRRSLGEDCTLVLRPDPGMATVRADRGQIEQVLLNLALNARDAMPEGGRFSIETSQVTLTPEYGRFMTEVIARPGPYALLVVSDTGQGMDRRTLQQAFEPFFTTKPVGQGTGLGLSTVYGTVKQSGGYIWAYSEPGQGTTFKIYLPVDASARSDPAQPPVAPSAVAGEVVVVVEDEESVRTMTGRLLESEGYGFVGAADGREALELIRKGGRVDLVITDVAMPGLNGRELADQVKRLRPELPVLFMSGYTDDEMVRRGLLEPDHPFLSKPFTPEALAAKVRQLIDQAVRGP
jgi:two-component system cell cycle sensor histidine kinase/response regulator CckA